MEPREEDILQAQIHDEERNDDAETSGSKESVWLSLENKHLKRKLKECEEELNSHARQIKLQEHELRTLKDRNAKLECLLGDLREDSRSDEDTINGRAQRLLMEILLSKAEDRLKDYQRICVNFQHICLREVKSLRSRMNMLKHEVVKSFYQANQQIQDGLRHISLNLEQIVSNLCEMFQTEEQFQREDPIQAPPPSLKTESLREEKNCVEEAPLLASAKNETSSKPPQVDDVLPRKTDFTSPLPNKEPRKAKEKNFLSTSVRSTTMDLSPLIRVIQDIARIVLERVQELDNFSVASEAKFSAMHTPTFNSLETAGIVHDCQEALTRVRSLLVHYSTLQRKRSLQPVVLLVDIQKQRMSLEAEVSQKCRDLLASMYISTRAPPMFQDVMIALQNLANSPDLIVQEKMNLIRAHIAKKNSSVSSLIRKLLALMGRMVVFRRLLHQLIRDTRRSKSREQLNSSENDRERNESQAVVRRRKCGDLTATVHQFYDSLVRDDPNPEYCRLCMVPMWCVDCASKHSFEDPYECRIFYEELRSLYIHQSDTRSEILRFKCTWIQETHQLLEDFGLVHKVTQMTAAVPLLRPRVALPEVAKNYFSVLRERREKAEEDRARCAFHVKESNETRVLAKEGHIVNIDVDRKSICGDSCNAQIPIYPVKTAGLKCNNNMRMTPRGLDAAVPSLPSKLPLRTTAHTPRWNWLDVYGQKCKDEPRCSLPHLTGTVREGLGTFVELKKKKY